MRRQVKPFVTEYRGSVRRTRDVNGAGDLQTEMQAPRSRTFAEAERAFHAEAPDDSYEAALRAADALFAASAPEPVDRRDPAIRSVSDTSVGEVSFVETPPPAPATPIDHEPTVSPGRILQAIEPAVEDRFAALEAERAPKRRGRKPGSKNKPKIFVGDDWAAAETSTLGNVRALHAFLPPPPSSVAKLDKATDLGNREPADSDEVADDALPRPRGRTDKFGWKRAGLRPGERWKRRLPKSAR